MVISTTGVVQTFLSQKGRLHQKAKNLASIGSLVNRQTAIESDSDPSS